CRLMSSSPFASWVLFGFRIVFGVFTFNALAAPDVAGESEQRQITGQLPTLDIQEGKDLLPRFAEDGVVARTTEQVTQGAAKLVRRLGPGKSETPTVVFPLKSFSHCGHVALVLVGNPAIAFAEGLMDGPDHCGLAVMVPECSGVSHGIEPLPFKGQLVT